MQSHTKGLFKKIKDVLHRSSQKIVSPGSLRALSYRLLGDKDGLIKKNLLVVTFV